MTVRYADMTREQKLKLRQAIPAELLAAAKLRSKQKHNLADFVKGAWAIIEPNTPLVWNWHIEVMCEALERVAKGEIRHLMINVPPGCMKSSVVSVCYPAWRKLHLAWYTSIHASYSQKLVLRDSRKEMAIVKSTWYQNLLSPDDQFDLVKDAEGEWQTTTDAKRLSLTVKGEGTGFRAHEIIIDDPLNVDDPDNMSKAALEGVQQWFDQRMHNRLNDMVTGAYIIIMQRVHEDDLCGYLLKKADGSKWTHIKLPSEYEPETACAEDRRTYKGELLFPARFPDSTLEADKISLGPYGYSAQHRQDPVPAGGGIFQVASICFWYPTGMPEPQPWVEKDHDGNSVPCHQMELPVKFDREIQSWDCAFKDTESSDFVVGQAWGVYQAKMFLLEQVHARLSFSNTLQAIRDMAHRRPRAVSKFIEEAANGIACIDTLQRELWGVTAVPPKGGKMSRANACGPYIRAKNVYLPHPAVYDWVKLTLLPELKAFPKGKHDDQVDALSQAIAQMAEADISWMQALTRFPGITR